MRTITLGILAALAPGCALHVNGRTQPVMIVTDPPGAEVLYGDRLFRTPVLINMRRQSRVSVDVHKSGFATTTAEFRGDPEEGLLILSFLFYGGPIGLAADLISGAHLWMGPDTRSIMLEAITEDRARQDDANWFIRKRALSEPRDPWGRRRSASRPK